MKLNELKDLLRIYDSNKAEYNLLDDYACSLVVSKVTPPRGYSIMTPFGRCEILRVNPQLLTYDVVFLVKRSQLVRVIAKLEKAMAS